MRPPELQASTFNTYPTLARRVAVERLAILQRLPLSFAPLLLRELISYDWKFPAERKLMDDQLSYLAALTGEQRDKTLAPFARIEISQDLERLDWVNEPATFSERFSAHLWASHQIDAFHAAATAFFDNASAAVPAQPLPLPRLGVVIAGQGVKEANSSQLFKKLRKQGTLYRQVRDGDGLSAIADALQQRAASHPVPYGHWYIDGATPPKAGSADVVSLSYEALTPARAALQERMQRAYDSSMGSEAFRSMLARMRPEELGLDAGKDGVMRRFELSVLTEGSGTQVYSTVFVQWAAREALRRAQPLTLVARFTPRQRERGMDELLNETRRPVVLDPQGSLIDAGMGAYLTWLNLERLSGVEPARFLVWFENHGEVLGIGPGVAKGAESAAPVDVRSLIERLTRV